MVRLRWTAFGAAVLSGALALGLPAPSAGAAPVPTAGAVPGAVSSGQPRIPATGVYFGAYTQRRDGQDQAAANAALESAIGRKLDLTRVYRLWDDAQPDSVVVADLSRGRTPVLSIRPQYREGRTVVWARIAAGVEDAAIIRQADGLKSLNQPIFLSFHHEPDDVAAAGYGTPAEYVAAWRRYRAIFAARGATNVAFTWILTPTSFRTGAATNYYPGDDAVDWVAQDAYNWLGCAAGKPTSWRSVRELMTPFATWAAPHGKPLMLAEYGSVEDLTLPDRKAGWLTDALAAARDFPQLKAVSYFHATGTCRWWADSSVPALAAFGRFGADPYAHARPSASLVPSATIGTAPLAVRFDVSASTGTGYPTGTGVTSWVLDFGDGTAPATGVGPPPGAVDHRYPRGTFAARLTVTDATGGTNVDGRTIIAAGAPTVSIAVRDVTATTAVLRAWVGPQGLASTATVEWGRSPTYGRQVSQRVAATTGTATVNQSLFGLTPNSRHVVRITVVTPAGRTTVTATVTTGRLPTRGSGATPPGRPA